MLLLLELVEDEVLQGFGECRCGELTVANLLDVAGHIALYGVEGHGAQNVYNTELLAHALEENNDVQGNNWPAV